MTINVVNKIDNPVKVNTILISVSDKSGLAEFVPGLLSVNPDIKIYQASSSEMFGKVREIPQKETTPFYPRSPYGVAKLYGFWIVKNF